MFKRIFSRFLFVLLLISVCKSLPIASNATGPEHESEWIQVPTPTWEMTWVHRSAVEAQNRIKWGFKELDVSFVFYSQSNLAGATYRLSELINLNDVAVFNRSRPTRVLVHGWLNHRDSPFNMNLRLTYLERWDYNVIVVDWSSCAGRLNYIAAAFCVSGVGQIVGMMLWNLKISKGLALEDVYVIGHSLGAHVAGISGKTFGWKRISTIVALDPAFPLFGFWDKNSRVDKGDAQYVEVIHTNGGILGFLEPIGKADFYPNGGVFQPGCGFNIAACAHSRAWELFLESLMEPQEYLMAKQIQSLGEIPFAKDNSNKVAKMGGEPSNWNVGAAGLYYMKTGDRSPYFDPNKVNLQTSNATRI